MNREDIKKAERLDDELSNIEYFIHTINTINTARIGIVGVGLTLRAVANNTELVSAVKREAEKIADRIRKEIKEL